MNLSPRVVRGKTEDCSPSDGVGNSKVIKDHLVIAVDEKKRFDWQQVVARYDVIIKRDRGGQTILKGLTPHWIGESTA
ncbi:unnamed protein product [Larinioides sclopetarius]|uniref:Uncharacterized protein n=1 Tax=Larinioides sclopetarius TaxID=280406 RepID=A0AAV2AF60_9ARAC